ncbi:ABC transporter permease [Rhodococcus sp. X156]|uniref:ABC transporter permease n=1 Tax=Rhodococcus sp. X156 TaxID=2499145 RepID=UPI000FD7A78C|nr:ABC transporter permease [Rhodococcus sp. X156]
MSEQMTATDGRAPGYRIERTLRVGVELRRQVTRRRTQITMGFLALLPFLLVLAFTLGDSSSTEGGSFVDRATTGGLGFTVFTLFASIGFLLVVVVALFFGDSVSSEASWSSLRYLLAIPVPRGRLLRQKSVVAGLLSLFALVLLPAVALAVGTALYGTGDIVSPLGDTLSYGPGLVRLLGAIVYIAISLLWVAGLASLLSVATDAPLGAVGGAVMVTIVSEILDGIPALEGLRDYLPTHHAYAWTALLSTDVDWSRMAWGTLSSLIYATVFGAAAWYRFSRKDITS